MVKITADSTCDLSPGMLHSLDISIIPLSIVVDGKAYRDGIDITPTDVFRYVDEEKRSCHTAAVNVYEYQCVFSEAVSRYGSVVHISLGSGFSSCYKNAVLAAQGLENVYVVDSQNLSTGSGLLVYAAALMAQEGLAPDKIYRQLNALVPKIEASFVIDRLDYLRNGGRCSALAAQSAQLLRIKPSIEVCDGVMRVGRKYRGSLARCLENYVIDRLSNRSDIDYKRIFVTHSQCAPDVVALVKNTINQFASFAEVIETQAGCTISNHCGPNTLGILFMRR